MWKLQNHYRNIRFILLLFYIFQKVKKTSNLNQQKKQTDSKFIRSCHRPDQQQPERLQRILLDKAPCVRTGPNVGTGARGRENASDNVNQPDNVKPSLVASASKLKGNYAIGAVEAELGRQQQNAKSVTTDSWDGILTSTNTGMSLAQIKSKVKVKERMFLVNVGRILPWSDGQEIACQFWGCFYVNVILLVSDLRQ